MKTKTMKYFKSVLLVLAMVSLAACEVAIDGFYDDDNIGGGYYNKSRELCSRTWVRSYYNIDGYYCRQEIDFLSGQDRDRLYPRTISQWWNI